MNYISIADPLQTLRETLAEIDREPRPLTHELVLLQDFLDKRLRRIEGESQRVAGTKLDDKDE